jgi:Mrp family chromosome partitioning ATPase
LSYKKKALTGVLWSSIQSFGTQSVSFVISIVLARLLLPEEFGLIAMITAFLLANGNFETLINEARAIYDYIVIDLAPTILVTDTLLIADQADATICAVRANHTDKKLIPFSVNLCKTERLKNMSYVINGIKENRSYGYSYNYGYNYGYGEL